MAENNSSAPLKTAEGAYPALPKPDYPAQFDGHGGEQSSDESYSAEQMRAYAVQAVAAAKINHCATCNDHGAVGNIITAEPCPDCSTPLAAFLEGQWWVQELDAIRQASVGSEIKVTPDMLRAVAVVHHMLRSAKAAPAAVAVPGEREVYIDWLSGSHPRVFSKTDAEAYWRNEHVSALAWQARAALAATPALPATEDGSAGDLENKVKNFMALVYDWSEKDLVAAEARLDPWTENDPSVPLGLVERLDEEANVARKSIEAKLIEILQSTPSQAAPQAQPADALDAETVKKAARYDWIREQGMLADGSRHPHSWRCVALLADMGGELADEAIDAAMAAAQEGDKA